MAHFQIYWCVATVFSIKIEHKRLFLIKSFNSEITRFKVFNIDILNVLAYVHGLN